MNKSVCGILCNKKTLKPWQGMNEYSTVHSKSTAIIKCYATLKVAWVVTNLYSFRKHCFDHRACKYPVDL